MANNLNQNKILVILTGGTICSTLNQNLKNQSNASKAESYIINDFKRSNSFFKSQVEFDTIKLTPDILSENMTIKYWNNLLKVFKNQVNWQDYKGIIVLHGTDTLAYTSSLLSILLAGAPIPVFLVSAQLPLVKKVAIIKNGVEIQKEVKQPKSNGYFNFKASVELIMNGIAPNVYVVYRNLKNNKFEKAYVHLGSSLLQCQNYSDNFYSKNQVEIKGFKNIKWEGVPFETNTFYLNKINRLTNGVILIQPYLGLDYSKYNLENVKAIVHNTYHSSTVCVERKSRNACYSSYSILSLLDRCKGKIPIYLAPCDKDAYSYESTGDAISNGALTISNTTLETAYIKTLVAYSLNGVDKTSFINSSVNHEFVYKKSSSLG